MARLLSADRAAPIVAGLAGLAWFWFEMAPQRTEFPDTDSPAQGLAFIAAHPESWQQAGLALVVAGIALIATVLALRDRLASARSAAVQAEGDTQIGIRTISVIGLFAAFMLIGLGCVRLSGGPVLYVQGLDPTWGQMAYTVTQFVGTQLLLVGGMALLALWIGGVAWVGARRGVMPRLVAILAILPAVRLLANPVLLPILPDGLWIVLVAAIPAAFAWLVLFGAWPTSSRATAPNLAVSPSTI